MFHMLVDTILPLYTTAVELHNSSYDFYLKSSDDEICLYKNIILEWKYGNNWLKSRSSRKLTNAVLYPQAFTQAIFSCCMFAP